MDDDREIRELAEAVARLHNPPPPTPRERMWARIAARRTDGRAALRRRRLPSFTLGLGGWRLAAAAAAVLAVGIGIGRMTAPGSSPDSLPPTGTSTATHAPAGRSGPSVAAARDTERFRLAATALFGRAEILLTDFKVGPCAAQDRLAGPAWAGGMLLQTRVLLDEPQAVDPEMRALLEDLELVLAQIAGLSRSDCVQDMAWIRAGMRDRATLDRLRAAADDGIPLQSL